VQDLSPEDLQMNKKADDAALAVEELSQKCHVLRSQLRIASAELEAKRSLMKILNAEVRSRDMHNMKKAERATNVLALRHAVIRQLPPPPTEADRAPNEPRANVAGEEQDRASADEAQEEEAMADEQHVPAAPEDGVPAEPPAQPAPEPGDLREAVEPNQ